MGTPLPPNEPGNDCTRCWGPTKTFGLGPTPSVLQLRFTNLQPGQFWVPAAEQSLLAPHYCIQTIFPCQWDENFPPWFTRVAYGAVATQIFLRYQPTNRFAFQTIIAPQCTLSELNEIKAFPAVFAFDGQVDITWDLEGL